MTEIYIVIGKADVIVSGDQDLVTIEQVGDIPILTAARFLEMLEQISGE